MYRKIYIFRYIVRGIPCASTTSTTRTPTDTVAIIITIATITPITPVPGVIGFPDHLTGGAATPAGLAATAVALHAAGAYPPTICS